MEKRDYLLDQIEQMGKVIAALLSGFLGLKAQGKAALALEVSRRQMREEVDIDIELILNLSEKELKRYLKERKLIQHHLDKLALYFLEIGESLQEDNRNEAGMYLLKARQLLELSAEFTRTLSLGQIDTQNRINHLLQLQYATESNFRSYPCFKTNRLVMNRLQPTDESKVELLRSNDVVNRYIDRPKKCSRKEAAAFIQKINDGIDRGEMVYYWAIRFIDHPDLIGTICIWNFSEDGRRAEIGYELFPEFHRKGLMDESLKPVIEYAFGVLNLQILEAYTHKNNEASSRLLLKNGFRKDESQSDPENPLNEIYCRTP
ncbi:MAG: GNAT family N-acetyltransferase [Bacteroidales bacterium]|nr:GNAT family N-acetyltransferase [Bacteroidales bacterium]